MAVAGREKLLVFFSVVSFIELTYHAPPRHRLGGQQAEGEGRREGLLFGAAGGRRVDEHAAEAHGLGGLGEDHREQLVRGHVAHSEAALEAYHGASGLGSFVCYSITCISRFRVPEIRSKR